jgi:hypothetical protein
MNWVSNYKDKNVFDIMRIIKSSYSYKINVETSDLNPSVMCTSKSKNNWRQIDFDQTV